MKTAIVIALSALFVTAPAVLAQNVASKKPDHHASRMHHRIVSAGHAPRHAMHAKGLMGYPGAFGYAPSEPKDYIYENSRNAGGGGGGGSM